MAISDYEWERLNAYIDGELAAEDACAVETLLRNREDLRQERDRLLALKASLQNLRPENISGPEKPLPSLKRPVFQIAASLLIAVGLGISGLLFYQSTEQKVQTPVSLHASFSEKTYILQEKNPKLTVSGLGSNPFGIPDLTPSALVLADVLMLNDQEPAIIAMHYRGQRGCRVTLVATGRTGSEPKNISPVATHIQKRIWQNEEFDFALLATGMDEKRFHSIADYAMENTGTSDNPDLKDLRVAMQESFENARPCV
ncbi:MAG: hypothetical protein MI743_17090 [Sneathiellales bacterium]|nr:hypothetical protein [Sneathiellales bacterium]